jgi:hypothetical protein
MAGKEEVAALRQQEVCNVWLNEGLPYACLSRPRLLARFGYIAADSELPENTVNL